MAPSRVWLAAFSLLVVSRLLSSAFNIVHDCDEVFNYWEPLHHLIHGSGMQTWEYRCSFPICFCF